LTCAQGGTCVGSFAMSEHAAGFYTVLLQGDGDIISMKVIKN
jgi:hypothetical protein